MNSYIIHDPTFPHGRPEGFTEGCHGSHCPAAISCADTATRYRGDWAFRKLIEAGMTVEDIAAEEQKRAQEAADAALRAKRARPGPRAGASTGDRRGAANKARTGEGTLIPRHVLRELLNKGLTDREIADQLGLHRRQVTGTRNTAGWARNPDSNRRPVPEAPATTGASSSHQEKE